ncbi:MAG: hypothetical protein R3D02_15230 [Hyphomicrobiales bacterium]
MGGGYLAATGYLVYRDQILDNHHARQAAMQHQYEDRIALLRAEIDRITSRQMIDKEAVEAKIDLLLDRKHSLDQRGEQLAKLMEKARGAGIAAPISGPLPEPNPTRGLDPEPVLAKAQTISGPGKADRADFTGSISAPAFAAAPALTAAPAEQPAEPSLAEAMGLRTSDASFLEPAAPQAAEPAAIGRMAMLPDIQRIEHDFAAIEAQQATAVALLAEKTAEKVKQIRKTLASLGYDTDKLIGREQSRNSVSGLRASAGHSLAAFDDQIDTVARSLSDLDKLRQRLRHRCRSASRSAARRARPAVSASGSTRF